MPSPRPGTLDALTAALWGAVLSVEPLLSDPDPDVRLKAAGTLAQLAGQYARLYPQAADPAQVLSERLAQGLAQRWGIAGGASAPDPQPGERMRAAAQRAQEKRRRAGGT